MTARRRAVAAPAELWMIDLSAVEPDDAASILSSHEQARAARFRMPEDRRRYRIAHAEVRRLLAGKLGCRPARVRFAIDGGGMPRLHGCADLHFSLSYAGDRALVGISTTGAIGVDIERLRPIDDADDLARSHFSACEAAAVDRAPPGPVRDRTFLQGWTRKEACVKAVGAGLSLATGGFVSGVDREPRTVTLTTVAMSWAVDVISVEAADDLAAAVSLARPE